MTVYFSRCFVVLSRFFDLTRPSGPKRCTDTVTPSCRPVTKARAGDLTEPPLRGTVSNLVATSRGRGRVCIYVAP